MLTGNGMWQQGAYQMIQRRAAVAGIKTRIGNHTFRATGITPYLKNSGKLESRFEECEGWCTKLAAPTSCYSFTNSSRSHSACRL